MITDLVPQIRPNFGECARVRLGTGRGIGLAGAGAAYQKERDVAKAVRM